MPEPVSSHDAERDDVGHGDDTTPPHQASYPPAHSPESAPEGNADVGAAETNTEKSAQDVSWEEVEAVFAAPLKTSDEVNTPTSLSMSWSDPSGNQPTHVAPTPVSDPPLALVETAFLASTGSLLWLISYYLSIGPWMRILFPIPIALVYLRWGGRSGWMAAIVSGLLLSVLMGPYLSILFLIPYGVLGVQLGFLWRRRVSWGISITIGTIVATFSLFFRLWLLSTFLGEDLWIYLTGRITDLLEWVAMILVNWGILGVGMLGQPDLRLVQIATVGMILFSDLVYLFTVHLTAWLLMERLGTPISKPPQWVQVILDEA